MTGRTMAAFELPHRRRRAVLSLAPLIDVTFILLIFFMLVTQFQRFAPVDVTLGPKEDLALFEPRQRTYDSEKLVLEIHADGVIRFTGRNPISAGELPDILAREFAGTPASDAEKPVIAVAPEPDVPLQLLIDVLSVVQKHPSLRMHIIIPAVEEGEAE